jgi:hypothetical protein
MASLLLFLRITKILKDLDWWWRGCSGLKFAILYVKRCARCGIVQDVARASIGNYLRFAKPLTGVFDASHGGLLPLTEVFCLSRRSFAPLTSFRGRTLAIALRNSRICIVILRSSTHSGRILKALPLELSL